MVHGLEQFIHRNCSNYVSEHCVRIDDWSYTLVGDCHPELLSKDIPGQPIVSFYVQDWCWFLLTTQRVAGFHRELDIAIEPRKVTKVSFGKFTNLGTSGIGEMTLQTDHGDFRLAYETGNAAMATIYYFRFWLLKHKEWRETVLGG